MKTLAERTKTLVPAALIALLVVTGFAPAAAYSQRRTSKRAPAAAKAPLSPFAQSYAKGYTDGFAQGATDWSNNLPKDFHRSDKWQQRDTGSSEESRQGYELGFELAYSDGYYGRARDNIVPRNAEVLAKAAALADQQRAGRDRQSEDRGRRNDDRRNDTGRGSSRTLSIPNDTELKVRLTSGISTKDNKVGDTFKATVIQSSTLEGSIVEGHIATLKKSGRVSGKTEVGLAFDSITTTDGRYARIDGQLVRVYESESVKRVDEEGRVETGTRTRDSEVRGGIGAAAGAIIGGIIGGGKGALIGLVVGGAAGVGSVYVEGNKDLELGPGTEMVIRVASSKER